MIILHSCCSKCCQANAMYVVRHGQIDRTQGVQGPWVDEQNLVHVLEENEKHLTSTLKDSCN